eukprot:3558810-Pyramimonas_sp.AAC.1
MVAFVSFVMLVRRTFATDGLHGPCLAAPPPWASWASAPSPRPSAATAGRWSCPSTSTRRARM